MSPFVLSLSKHERTRSLLTRSPFDELRANGVYEALPKIISRRR